jgi:hypothetical protein
MFRGFESLVGLWHGGGDHVLYLAPADPHQITTSLFFYIFLFRGFEKEFFGLWHGGGDIVFHLGISVADPHHVANSLCL